LFDTFFSIFNDHVYGGYTNQFPSEYERRRSFAITTLLLGIGVTGLGVVASILVVYGDPSSFVRLAIIVVIIMAVLTVLLLLGVKESDEMKEMFIKSYEQTEQIGFKKTMKTALKTKNFRISLIGYTCQITAMTLTAASMIFMYQYVWRLDYSYYVIPQLLGLATFLGLIPFWSNYAKKKGFKKTYWLCFVLHGISFLPFLFITPALGYPLFYMLICVFALVQGVFYCGEVIMLMPVASDTYDLVSSEIGRRVDATLVGVRTFFFRLSFIIVIVVIGVIHILTAFDPTPEATQTSIAILGIQVHAYLIPAIIFIVMGFIFRKHYTLEGAEKEALVRKLKDMEIYR
jgi:Na+/melibiose symporter-like transporter